MMASNSNRPKSGMQKKLALGFDPGAGYNGSIAATPQLRRWRLMLRALTAVLLLASWPALSCADEQPDARAILDRALHAAGLADKADLRAMTWKGKVKLYGAGDPVTYDGQWFIGPPDRARIEMRGQFHGRDFKRVLIVNGDRGWMVADGRAEALDGQRLDEERERLHAAWVATLSPVREADFDLSTLRIPPAMVRIRSGLRVAHAGHRPVELYFDRDGLLVESRTQRHDANTGVRTNEVVRYGRFRNMDGVKLPTRLSVLVNGKLVVEGTVSAFRWHKRLDAALFERPE